MGQQAFGMGNGTDKRPLALSSRDLVEVIFRRRRAIAYTFFGLLAGVLLAMMALPKTYEAQMEIFLDHNRIHPAVTPVSNVLQEQGDLTQDEVASEVELFLSRDSLEKAVVDLGLYHAKYPSLLQRAKLRLEKTLGLYPNRATRIYQATIAMQNNLEVIPVNNSNVLRVTYDAHSPILAARVLRELGKLYFVKRAQVHQSWGAVAFFHDRANNFKQQVQNNEDKLVSFDKQTGAVSAAFEMQAALERLSEFNVTLAKANADIAQERAQIANLEGQGTGLPKNVVAQRSVSTNPQLMASLESTLLQLEIRRTKLLERYAPSYPLVKEVEKQIAESHAAIAAAEQQGAKQVTTARNPLAEWVASQLAKDRADLVGDQARAKALSMALADMQQRALNFEQDAKTQQDFQRNEKLAEANYVLYANKAEEARIDQELDHSGIVNASLAEAPVPPMVPVGLPLPVKLVLAMLVAGILSLGAGFLMEYVDPKFRSPRDVEEELGVPLIAAIPTNGH